jgi:hypothetical protein
MSSRLAILAARSVRLSLDNPLGREMMTRQFCRLGEVHSLVYGCRASGENGRKLTASTRVGLESRTRVGLESRLMDYLGLTIFG